VSGGASPSAEAAASAQLEPPVIAVDCNGADLGAAEVAAGAAAAARRGVRVLLFGPAAEIGELPAGVELVDAPVSIAKAPDPVKAARTTAEASSAPAAPAPRSRPGRSTSSARAASTGPRWRSPCPCPTIR
jgi:phosphate acyltransferase